MVRIIDLKVWVILMNSATLKVMVTFRSKILSQLAGSLENKTLTTAVLRVVNYLRLLPRLAIQSITCMVNLKSGSVCKKCNLLRFHHNSVKTSLSRLPSSPSKKKR